MFRTALIALALSLALAACVAPARAASDAAPAPQDTRPVVIHHPTTFICVPAAHPAKPGGPSESTGEQRQPIPPGKKIEDLCPPGAHFMLFLDTSPFPWVNCLSPPLFSHAAGPPTPRSGADVQNPPAPPQPYTGAKTP